MAELTFEKWPSIPRWANDTVTITEKIDGTNAALIILPYNIDHETLIQDGYAKCWGPADAQIGDLVTFAVQSRKRFIKPGKDTDNAGFAAYAFEHAPQFIALLGYGKHYGEWWGRGIQRGYGLDEKRLSLFSPWRYEHLALKDEVPGLDMVPVLYSGGWDGANVKKELTKLEEKGSVAAPGFKKPEGLIVQSAFTGAKYKAFTWDDGIPKSLKEGN